MKTETTLVSQKYLLKNGDVTISVEKDCATNTLSVYRHQYFNQPLFFKESTKEMCETIGKLLIEASKL